MSKNVAVIGLGQLGRRYLEGLQQSTSKVSVWAVDSNEDSLEQAHRHISRAVSPVPISFHNSIRDLPANVDLAISATTADVRVSTLRQLLKGRNVRYLILEKVLAQSLSESEQLTRLAAQVQQVWVNYPRRVMAWHGHLHEYVNRSAPLRASVFGASWGLITNGLHFIDLFEWWIGLPTQKIRVRGRSLEWFESNRPGFLEATGTIDVTFRDDSVLTLQSFPKGSQPGKTEFDVYGGGATLNISESDGVASGSMLEGAMTGRVELQSELTGPTVDQILDNGVCGLPTLRDVLPTHKLFISTLLAEQDRRSGAKGRLAIT